jgi:hypothetical protein
LSGESAILTNQTQGLKPVKIYALFFLLVVMASAEAQQLPSKTVPRSRDMGPAADGIVGIVVNGTMTPNGNEFYKLFTILWSEKLESREYSLHIDELLSKRYGNKIVVYFGQKPVYSGALPLKYPELKAMCEKAVEETQANILASMIMPATDDADIVKEQI